MSQTLAEKNIGMSPRQGLNSSENLFTAGVSDKEAPAVFLCAQHR